MIAILFLAALAGIADASTSPLLACPSGAWAGNDGTTACANIAAGQCTFATPLDVATANAPSLLDGEAASGGQLTLQMRHGLTQGRRVVSIELSDNAACNYPGANWRKYVGADDDACLDAYNATIPWPTAYAAASDDQAADACGLTRIDTDPTYLIFEGSARVTMLEPLGAQRDGAPLTRTIVSVLRFRVKFVRRASVSSGVAVYADPRLLAAVTQQEWRAPTADGLVGLTTSLQWPFRVASISVTAPSGITTTVPASNPASDCTPEQGGSCSQLNNFVAAPDAYTCRLDGVYAVVLGLECHASVAAADCPIAAGGAQATAAVNVTLQSEDVCAVVEELVGVELGLSSHATFDAALFSFGAEQRAFFQDQAIHWQLGVESVDGFALATTTLEQVRVTLVGGAEVAVYTAGGAAPNAAWAFSSAFDGAGATALEHAHHFQFTPAPSVFGAVAADGSEVSQVTAVVGVVFADTNRKRTSVERVLYKRQAPAAGDKEVVQASGRMRLAPQRSDLMASSGSTASANDPDFELTSGASSLTAFSAIGALIIGFAVVAL